MAQLIRVKAIVPRLPSPGRSYVSPENRNDRVAVKLVDGEPRRARSERCTRAPSSGIARSIAISYSPLAGRMRANKTDETRTCQSPGDFVDPLGEHGPGRGRQDPRPRYGSPLYQPLAAMVCVRICWSRPIACSGLPVSSAPSERSVGSVALARYHCESNPPPRSRSLQTDTRVHEAAAAATDHQQLEKYEVRLRKAGTERRCQHRKRDLGVDAPSCFPVLILLEGDHALYWQVSYRSIN